MIHYHGTGGSGSLRDDLLLFRGRHIFFTFADCVRLAALSQVCQSFALDNGAYSTWKSGKAFDFEGYCEFVETWRYHPAFDFCVIPDKIDGNEKDNDDLLEAWPFPNLGVPVYHFHESLDRLQALVEKWPIVCLGSSEAYEPPNSIRWWERMAAIMKIACDEKGRPRCKLHGLRMLDPRVFTRLPLHSADSTNADRNGVLEVRFGMYCPPTRGQRSAVIADRIENQQSATVWEFGGQEEFDLVLG